MAPLDDLDLSYVVVTCDRCGTGYADQTANEDAYSRYYATFSKYDVARSLDEIPALVRAIAEGAADFVRPHLLAGSRVCDVGSAIGVFLDALRRRGVDHVVGYDPAPQAPAVAADLFDVEVRPGFLDGHLDVGAFDLVSLIAVAEHLLDPHAALAPIAASMRPGSLLLLEVPAADRFHETSGEWLGEFSIEHVNFFGAHGLAVLAARLGLERVDQQRVVYPNGQRGLRALFRRAAAPVDPLLRDDDTTPSSLQRYLTACDDLGRVIDQVLDGAGEAPWILYGAGAHSARLLRRAGVQEGRFLFAADRNRNLHGHRLGGLDIMPPDAIGSRPNAPIIVSTFHARAAIQRDLAGRFPNPCIELYPPARGLHDSA